MRFFLIALFALALAVLAVPAERSSSVVYGADYIPGRYIVVLEDGADAEADARDLGRKVGFEADAVYSSAISGFAAEMSPEEAERVAQSDGVASVVADQRVSISIHENPFQTLPTGVDRTDADLSPTASITSGGPDLDIDVAVIDTGVVPGHVDLNVAGGPELECTGNTTVDGHGHGTHVAGTIAAIDDDHGVTGMAPGARVWAVKVLADNGNGESSCVIAGVDWVTDRRLEYNDGPGDGDPGINIQAANLSLGGPAESAPEDSPMCQAFDAAIAAGVIIVVAAGNEHDDASAHEPAHCPNAITVSAFADFDGQPGALSTDIATSSSCQPGQQTITDDTFACFSNWGSSVDIAAPGVAIMSTYPGPGGTCDVVSCYATNSGTSMATPHVTGAVLLLRLEGYNGPANGDDVIAAMHAAGYTRSQNSDCGFTGDHPGDPAEPVLYMGPLCPDSDHDSFPNTIDNCRNVANISQANQDGDEYGDACEQPNCVDVVNHWAVPPGDSDCDGYADTTVFAPRASEQTIGTLADQKCMANPGSNNEPLPDAWPPDFNDNQLVNVGDVLTFNFSIGQVVTNPPVNFGGTLVPVARWDLNGSGLVNVGDILQLNFFMFTRCDGT